MNNKLEPDPTAGNDDLWAAFDGSIWMRPKRAQPGPGDYDPTQEDKRHVRALLEAIANLRTPEQWGRVSLALDVLHGTAGKQARLAAAFDYLDGKPELLRELSNDWAHEGEGIFNSFERDTRARFLKAKLAGFDPAFEEISLEHFIQELTAAYSRPEGQQRGLRRAFAELCVTCGAFEAAQESINDTFEAAVESFMRAIGKAAKKHGPPKS